MLNNDQQDQPIIDQQAAPRRGSFQQLFFEKPIFRCLLRVLCCDYTGDHGNDVRVPLLNDVEAGPGQQVVARRERKDERRRYFTVLSADKLRDVLQNDDASKCCISEVLQVRQLEDGP